jgi:hypothetical protein
MILKIIRDKNVTQETGEGQSQVGQTENTGHCEGLMQ